jgi:hypothetical protein
MIGDRSAITDRTIDDSPAVEASGFGRTEVG